MKNTFSIVIDGVNYAQNAIFPLKLSRRLDERLDEVQISLKHVDKDIFHPLTSVTIGVSNGFPSEWKGMQFVVSTDRVSETPIGSGFYNHEITALEPTKLLEGYVVDSLTFTNDLGRSYTSGAPYCTYYIEDNHGPDNSTPDDDLYRMTMGAGTFVVKSIAKAFSTNFKNIAIYNGGAAHPPDEPPHVKFSTKLYLNDEAEPILNEEHCKGEDYLGYLGGIDPKYTYEDYVLNLPTGTYSLVYRIYNLSSIRFWTDYIYKFVLVDNYDPLPRWTIASVLDRVFDVVPTRTIADGNDKLFYLDPDIRDKLDAIPSPEFAFTKCTLKEVLDQIGGYIHGVPRLTIGRKYYVTFDFLGEMKQSALYEENKPYVLNSYSQDIESFCTSIDSTADNLVCMTDEAQGSLVDPYNDGYKSVRTETVYARVDELNMFIETKYPIQKIISVKSGFIPGKNITDLDITPYIFESAEYNRMSGYSDFYPEAKIFALYYEQGKKNIRGLDFRRPKATNEYIEGNAIAHILSAAAGESVSDKGVLAWFKGMNYPLLSFQVSYIPIFSARTQQAKPYIGSETSRQTNVINSREIIYNQNAHIIETKYYGENMKGAVARMGNVDRVLTFSLKNVRYVPHIGELYGDDYYIADVTSEIHPESVSCMVTLSKDFNRLSQYIGIDSMPRFYEVSEKQAYRRDIRRTDYVVIGDDERAGTGQYCTIRHIVNALEQSDEHSVSYMIARGYDDDDNALQLPVVLPVVSTAQGNAMVFTSSFTDNFSAGAMVEYKEYKEISGYFTQNSQYCDYYGRVYSLGISMYAYSPQPTTEAINKDIALPLPVYSNNILNLTPALGNPGAGDRLIIRKDSREALSINYVINFVTNRQDIVIGSALARNCPLVRGADSGRIAKLYVLKRKVGKFESVVDLKEATWVYDFSASAYSDFDLPTGNKAYIKPFKPPVSGKSWVFVSSDTHELLFGQNVPITAGKKVTMPYITLKHKIFN